MGQAKSRGDYEARKAAAIARNEALVNQIDAMPKDHPIHKIRRRIPTQRLAVAMLSMGVLSQFQTKE